MSQQPKSFDSQAQAVSVLGISLEVLRQAKRAGCPAFRNGRIYRAELEQWLASGGVAPGQRQEQPPAPEKEPEKPEAGRAETLFFDSQEQAANHLGIPLDEIRHAKRAGCTAFRSGRVHRDILLQWLATNRRELSAQDSDASSERAEKARELRLKNQLREIQIAEAQGRLMDRAAVERGVGQMLIGIRAGLNSLPVSAPRWLEGKTTFDEKRAVLQREVDALTDALFEADFLEDLGPLVLERIEGDEEARIALQDTTLSLEDEPTRALVVRSVALALQILGAAVVPRITSGLRLQLEEQEKAK